MTRLTAAAIAAACGVSCSRSSAQAPPAPSIRLFVPSDKPESGFVEVVGLAPAELQALSELARDHPEQWRTVLQVSTTSDGPAMLGTLSINGGSLRFTPAFTFDRGRSYVVRFDPRLLPRLPGRSGEPLVTTVPATRRRQCPRRSSATSIRAAASCPRTCCGCTSSSPRRWASKAAWSI